MSLEKVKEALAYSEGMQVAYKDEVSMFRKKIEEMKACDHNWDRDTVILAEENGRDLSYYEAQCHKCGILKSEYADLTF
jgi:hypothetical protein